MPPNNFKQWYAKNKDELNAARKERYHSDPEYRQKIIERQKIARHKKPRPVTPIERRSFREIDGKKTQVFRIGAVCEYAGCSERTLRGWEQDGLIPPPTIPGRHRVYTEHQALLLRGFARRLLQLRYDRRSRKRIAEFLSESVKSQWGK